MSMNTKILLDRSFFIEQKKEIVVNKEFKINIFKYKSGVEAIEVENSRGAFIVLPYMGQMIWRASFDGIDLTMKNMFSQPRKTNNMLDTYGCFAFHSGLLANGCPGPDDTHAMHGEFCCAELDEAWIELADDEVIIKGQYEYCQGFGYKYVARPSVSLKSNDTKIKIGMYVKNLTSIEMPLQYMCHINYNYVDEGQFSANIPDKAFKLRESIPSHIHPTPNWYAYTDEIKEMQKSGKTLDKLGDTRLYDPEIVFLADDLAQYAEDIYVEIKSPKGYAFCTQFASKDFNYGTRWIMYNGDQQVSSCIIPGTCRPEGFLAAKKAGSLISLKPQEEKTFEVYTGLK